MTGEVTETTRPGSGGDYLHRPSNSQVSTGSFWKISVDWSVVQRLVGVRQVERLQTVVAVRQTETSLRKRSNWPLRSETLSSLRPSGCQVG